MQKSPARAFMQFTVTAEPCSDPIATLYGGKGSALGGEVNGHTKAIGKNMNCRKIS